MTRAMYETLPLSELKAITKARNMKGCSTLRKDALIDRMLEQDEIDSRAAAAAQDAAEAESKNKAEGGNKEKAAPERKARTSRAKKEQPAAENADPAAAEFNENAVNADSAVEEPANASDDAQEDSKDKRRSAAGARRPRKRAEAAEAKTDEDAGESDTADEKTDGQEAGAAASKGRKRVKKDNAKAELQAKAEPDNAAVQDKAKQPEAEKEYKHNSLDSGNEVTGILEVMADGYGFIRSDNFLPGDNDVYVSPSQIRKFSLKTGDVISGNTRVKSANEKFSALLYVTGINNMHPSENSKRFNFEDMTPIFPNERIHLDRPDGSIAMRIVDLISPIGKGQRGMIVSPPKAGKTTLLKDAAKSILRNNPEMHLIILLIDERPEEVTDMKETVKGDNVEVIYSTFDETPEHHKRVSEMVIERAKRLVESRKDVIIFIDSITRLARAYNQVVPPSGRTLSGGLDPAALHMPKRFFGAARNMREGGSLTILATALVDTGSKMDDVVYEEFKGTGNMELVLDRKLQERRIFPAIDIVKSGTRREDLLLTRDEYDAVNKIRRGLNGAHGEEITEYVINLFTRCRSNYELINIILKQKSW